MKWLTLVLACLLIPVSFAQTWKPVVFKAAGVTFQMPTPPQSSSRTDHDGGIAVKSHMWISSSPTANYVTSISMVPKSAPSSFIANMIEGIKKGFLESTSATVKSDKQAVYAGVTGRQVTFSTPSGANGALWIVRRGNNVLTMTVAKKGTSYDAERAKFFGSLKLAK